MAICKVSAATPLQLDWLVAKCEGLETHVSKTGFLIYPNPHIKVGPTGTAYSPSTEWSQGGPIIDREVEVNRMTISPPYGAQTVGVICTNRFSLKVYWGETVLIAAMRCLVASKFGEEVEVPNELAALAPKEES